MILILSSNDDFSTNEVIRWLNYYDCPWVRINEDDDVRIECLEYKDNKIVKFEIAINERKLELISINSYWFRRGYLNINNQTIKRPISADPLIDAYISRYLTSEVNNVIEFIHFYLQEEKRCIGSFLTAENNKTYYQFIASKVGLLIPDTIIATHKKQINDFWSQREKPIITKSINELFSFSSKTDNYYTKTYEVSEDYLKDASDDFYPTLIQRYVEKFLELRIFFLHDKVYPMAIFSQQNEQTKLDFRNYDHLNANRNVPFKLPLEIEEKIKIFMNTINLDCGSIDMILTSQNKFIFLEVNPVGQFGMVSVPCNYYLERQIAKKLITQ